MPSVTPNAPSTIDGSPMMNQVDAPAAPARSPHVAVGRAFDSSGLAMFLHPSRRKLTSARPYRHAFGPDSHIRDGIEISVDNPDGRTAVAASVC